MGLTSQSVGIKSIDSGLIIKKRNKEDKIIALAGNPNVGKSTIFNSLTGMKQHTGNWPGKTVANAQGYCKSKNKSYTLVDIPGTYSLLAHSPEEEIARNFICFSAPDAVVVVCDATCLERNLNLVLQTMEITDNVIVCVNLLDEAKRKGIKIDIDLLSKKLGVPVVGTVAKDKKSLNKLLDKLDLITEKPNNSDFQIKYPEPIEKAIEKLTDILEKKLENKINCRWLALRLIDPDRSLNKEIEKFLKKDLLSDNEIKTTLNDVLIYLYNEGFREKSLREAIASAPILSAEEICKETVIIKENYKEFDLKTDKILTSKKYGYPIMFFLLLVVFWITIFGANYISDLLSFLFLKVELLLTSFLEKINTPLFLKGLIIDGIYRIPAWVISVMLPPMAIFFPLFTLLEDIGYLPRIAYNLDKPFKKCRSCGKQALTMCMGFGCNAAGVVGCRIIDSKREKLLAIITNSLVPCNGRFPMIITLISVFFVKSDSFLSTLYSALILAVIIIFGILMTFLVTKILSITLLKGMPSSYLLEMPPFRKPEIGSVIIRSVFDRTLFVLGRSVMVAVPAGIIIWLIANINIYGNSILLHCTELLNPVGLIMGLDGVVLMAFILGFPANEIVLPLALMTYLSSGSITDISAIDEIHQILTVNGWTHITAICTIIFSLIHWPCSTTVLTIKKETGSFKWTVISVILPTLIGFILCVLINLISYI